MDTNATFVVSMTWNNPSSKPTHTRLSIQ